VIVAPLLAAVLELKTRVDSVRWLNERYTGREETVSKAICWRGLIFEASCAYSNISPLPVWAMSIAEKGGAYFRDDTVIKKSELTHAARVTKNRQNRKVCSQEKVSQWQCFVTHNPPLRHWSDSSEISLHCHLVCFGQLLSRSQTTGSTRTEGRCFSKMLGCINEKRKIVD
jgi:hypothetical protein